MDLRVPISLFCTSRPNPDSLVCLSSNPPNPIRLFVFHGHRPRPNPNRLFVFHELREAVEPHRNGTDMQEEEEVMRGVLENVVVKDNVGRQPCNPDPDGLVVFGPEWR